jgi:xanthine dehydrogenase accessory factor
MQDVIDDINQWRTDGAAIALATVVETWGSAPRKAGAKMALTSGGRMSGSVSGGCVEGAVFEAGVETLTSGAPQLLTYGVADETAWSVGLACGGSVSVFVETLQPAVQSIIDGWLTREGGGAVATVVGGSAEFLGHKLLIGSDGTRHGSIDAELDDAIAARAADALRARRSQRVTLTDSSLDLFIDVILPAPTLIIIGGVHIAVALAHLARTVGYQTVLVEPRRAFASPERFAHVDRLVQAWPKQALSDIVLSGSTAVAVLTHDPKIDDPALVAVLDSPVFYIGALGSRRTHAKRRERLAARGVSAESLDRIHAPIGLDINAQTPEEIALAIMAELVAAYRA